MEQKHIFLDLAYLHHIYLMIGIVEFGTSNGTQAFLKINHQTIGIKKGGLPELAVSSTCKTLHLFFGEGIGKHISTLKVPLDVISSTQKRHC